MPTYVSNMPVNTVDPTWRIGIYFGEGWSWFLGAGSVLRAGSGGGAGTVITFGRKRPLAAPDHHLRDARARRSARTIGAFYSDIGRASNVGSLPDICRR